MPFDYNSFMTGVIIGLKLGRVPKGRIPPLPSGRYILKEDGTPIVTESLVSQEATIYQKGTWYQYPQGSPYYPAYFRLQPGTSYFLYARFTDISASDPALVVWVNTYTSSLGRFRAEYTYDPVSGPIYTHGIEWDPNPAFHYMNMDLTYNQVNPFQYAPPPEGTTVFEGSFYSDLPLLLLGLKPLPLITEGG